ncbi:MAG: hypothetical protein ONB05_01840 [candidate division KSB1 bacterium]|nr:hypothetical protein [candidate division KSB1 bacterium]
MKKLFFIFLVILLLPFNPLTSASKEAKVLRLSLGSDGFVTAWLIRGPFYNPAADRREMDYLGGEARKFTLEELSPVALKEVPGNDNSKWGLYWSDSYVIRLAKFFEIKNQTVAYALCFVETPKAQKVLLKLGSDDGVKVWCNGHLVHDHPVYRGLRLDEDVVSAQLSAGINAILVKVDQGTGGWEFCLRLTDESGKPLSEATVLLPDKFSPEELHRQIAESFRVSTILQKTEGFKEFVFQLSQKASVPVIESAFTIKVFVCDRDDKVIHEVMEEVVAAAKVPEKKVIWKPEDLAVGMYLLTTQILDQSQRPVLSRSTPIFWY